MSGDGVANLEWMVVFFCGVLGKIFRARWALYGVAPGTIKMVTPYAISLSHAEAASGRVEAALRMLNATLSIRRLFRLWQISYLCREQTNDCGRTMPETLPLRSIRARCRAAALAILMATAASAHAQQWPMRAIKVVSPFPRRQCIGHRQSRRSRSSIATARPAGCHRGEARGRWNRWLCCRG